MKIILTLTLLMMFLSALTNLYAADQVVTNNNDDGAGSLRQAIADVGAGQEITFDDDYTITLASQLTISSNMTITGTGAGSTIIQANAEPDTAIFRVFEIDSGTVVISDMTIRNGKTGIGGGVYNDDTLTLNDCTISGNIASAGGGGVFSNSDTTITLNDCTITGNSQTPDAYHGGGGIYFTEDATITNCTISGNSCDSDDTGGGGLYLNGAAAIITNCTIANNENANESGSGGGGLCNRIGTLYIKNTIIANNTAGSGTNDFYKLSGTINNNGYNAVESQSGADFADGVDGCFTGAQCGANLSTTLADNDTLNGTQTLALSEDSVAVDAGSTVANQGVAIPSKDQRGYSRVAAPDMGSYEYDAESAGNNATFFGCNF